MERLTENFGDYIVVNGCKSYYPNQERKGAPMSNAIVRLAAYENTELTPEEVERLKEYQETELTPEEIMELKSIKSWADAVEREYLKFVELEKDRRLITLPCKVTDTVYILETVYKGKKMAGEQVVPAQIDRVIIGGTTGQPVYDLCSETGNWYTAMKPEDFYLTPEEAEMAMKEGLEK